MGKAKKLSERAVLLLRLVADRTDRDWSTGEVKRYFVPQHDPSYLQLPSGEVVSVWVHGGSDAAAFRSLESRGLIQDKSGPCGRYCYALTEEGHLFLTKLDEASS